MLHFFNHYSFLIFPIILQPLINKDLRGQDITYKKWLDNQKDDNCWADNCAAIVLRYILNVSKTLCLFSFISISLMEKVVKHFLFWQKYAETVCFVTFCIILKSKWLNLPKTFVSVKLVYFYAKIMFQHFLCYSSPNG